MNTWKLKAVELWKKTLVRAHRSLNEPVYTRSNIKVDSVRSTKYLKYIKHHIVIRPTWNPIPWQMYQLATIKCQNWTIFDWYFPLWMLKEILVKDPWLLSKRLSSIFIVLPKKLYFYFLFLFYWHFK